MSAQVKPARARAVMPLPKTVKRAFTYSEAVPGSFEDLTFYPSSDGLPMSDNTTQFEWISMLQGELDALFAEDPEVFVAGDLLWYPVRGNSYLRIAPDAMVVIGRPKGHRSSYLQWLEDNRPPQVVFEVLSPSNSQLEMLRKLEIYETHGVDEFYEYDPERNILEGWVRENGGLHPVAEMNGWVSPHLGIRFVLLEHTLEIYRPDGRKFQNFRENSRRADAEQRRADAGERRAKEQEQCAKDQAERAEKLAAKLRALGLDPDDVS
jgi:Uma2 family endonuclease